MLDKGPRREGGGKLDCQTVVGFLTQFWIGGLVNLDSGFIGLEIFGGGLRGRHGMIA